MDNLITLIADHYGLGRLFLDRNDILADLFVNKSHTYMVVINFHSEEHKILIFTITEEQLITIRMGEWNKLSMIKYRNENLVYSGELYDPKLFDKMDVYLKP